VDDIKKDENSHAEIPSNLGSIPPPPVASPIASHGDGSGAPKPTTIIESSNDEEEEFEYVENDVDHGFVDKVDHLMRNLNLSRRHFIIFSGCFSLLILGIIISFVMLFHFFGKESTDIVAPVNTIHANEEKVDDGEGVFSKLFGFLDKEDKVDEEVEVKDTGETEDKDSNVKVSTSQENEVSKAEIDKVTDDKDLEEEVKDRNIFQKFGDFILGKKSTEKDDVLSKDTDNDKVDQGLVNQIDPKAIEEADQENVDKVDGTVEKTSITVASQLGDMSQADLESVGVKAAIAYGLTSVRVDKLSYYVRTYRKVRNIFNIDLFNYLNTSEHRDKSFNEFLAQFKGANEQAKIAYEDLRQEIDLYTARFTKLNDRSIAIEEEFFTNLDDLASESLPDLLDAFQEITTQKTIVKSELAARKAIAEKYATALPYIDKKIEALEVNRDPYVKGVKVVEFQQVDLDLVIQGE